MTANILEAKMEYGSLPGIEKKISRLVQGAIHLGAATQEEDNDFLDAVLELGANTFDTARVYNGGKVELSLGAWQNSRANREDIVIIAKGAHQDSNGKRVNQEAIKEDVKISLDNLQTDYADIYMLHRDDPSVEVGPIVEVLNELQQEGKFKIFGGSNWSHTRIEAANNYAKEKGLNGFTCSSPNFSLAEQVEEPWPDCASISGPENAGARKWYADNQLALFTWSSLARGFFAGKITRANFEGTKADIDPACVKAFCYDCNFDRLDRVETLAREKGVSVPQLALAYVLSQPQNIFALVGAEKPEELKENLVSLNLKLSVDEQAWLDLRKDKI